MGPNRARLFCTEKRDVEIAYNDSFNLPRHALQGPEKSLPVCPSSVLKNTRNPLLNERNTFQSVDCDLLDEIFRSTHLIGLN